jgi:uncharacterized protein with FMN-binding domain
MKRISLWALGTVSALVLLLGYHTSTSGPQATDETASTSAAYSATGTSTTGQGATASGGTGGGGTDSPETFTGAVAQTQWGPVQVQIAVADTSITEVTVLEYPSGNGKDAEINDRALPILTEETIDAQGAGIDMVSGATVTSDGYVESLQSALDQAGL